MNEDWHPAIGDGSGTLHEQLLRTLRADIAAGALLPAGKMPPHRELAARLGIGVGTVTRAYAEAERLGLLTSTVGRGTFVAETAHPLAGSQAAASGPSTGVTDLSLNLQAHPLGTELIGQTLQRLQLRPDFASSLLISPPAGHDWQRQTLAAWFRGAAHHHAIAWERLLITTGALHAMSLVIDTHLRPGDTVLTEPVTFSGFRALVADREITCHGLAMDEEGVLPGSLARAAHETGARLAYLQPTLQNPTTRTMSRQRREEIVAVAREHDLTIIEDDVYGPFAFALNTTPGDLVPLAQLAPERTFYVSSASKTMAMGLRVGVLVAPDERRFERCASTLRASCYTTSSLAALLVCQMIVDGSAATLRDAIAQDATIRQRLARRLLGDALAPPSFDTSLHAWLPMPELRAERLANGALRRGVVLTPPTSFVVDGALESGLRLCLNAVPMADLERALVLVRSALADEVMPGRLAIV